MSGATRRGAGAGDRDGLALIEVIVALTLVLILLPGILLSSALAARDLQGAGDLAEWSAAVQYQMETVTAMGYLDVADGSATVDAHQMTWSVTSGAMKSVQVVVTAPNYAGKGKGKGTFKDSSADTLWVFLPATDSLDASDLGN